MATFLQMMAKYPEIAKVAQAEIDSVTNQERLPTIEDRENIPMIDCIMREVFRCVHVFSSAKLFLNLSFSSISVIPPVPMCKCGVFYAYTCFF